MKPVERTGYIDCWIIVKQGSTGQLYFDQAVTPLGNGFYKTLTEAQHQQTINLLKNEKTEIFHIEWPL
jgi:hypothetical protein